MQENEQDLSSQNTGVSVNWHSPGANSEAFVSMLRMHAESTDPTVRAAARAALAAMGEAVSEPECDGGIVVDIATRRAKGGR